MNRKIGLAIGKQIKNADRVLVVTHHHPEGDALGCQLGMERVVAKWGGQADMVLEGTWPPQYGFLPGIEKIRSVDKVEGHYDVTVVMDCAGVDRAGNIINLPDPSLGTVINIDHHLGNPGFGHLNLVDPAAAATGEVFIDLIDLWKIRIDADMALFIYTALAADTGAFSFPNTSPRTLRTAARLVETGIDFSFVNYRLFQQTSLGKAQLAGKMLSRVSQKKGVSWSTILLQDFRDTNTSPVDTENLVNIVNNVEGTKIGILFKEESKGVIRVSLRSRAGVDVAKIARRFGGGGHSEAAGCTLRGDFDTVHQQFLTAVREHLPRSGQ